MPAVDSLKVVVAIIAALSITADPWRRTSVGGDEREPNRVRSPRTTNSGDNAVMTNSIGMKLVSVGPGEFVMGSTQTHVEGVRNRAADFENEYGESEQPAHRVSIARPFYLGETEVTRGQFREFVDDTNYETEAESSKRGGLGFDKRKWEPEGFQPKYNWRNTGFDQTDEHPVVNVTWNDARKYCDWLSKKEEATYRLPTEAEWEFACRAGTTTAYQGGDDPEALARYGNVGDDTAYRFFGFWARSTYLGGVTFIKSRDGVVFTAPVRQFQPNAFGLYDMHGNVSEWCSDYYESTYYLTSPGSDPQGPVEGKSRVARGGAWLGSAWRCRSATRLHCHPSYRGISMGFRVALAPSEK